MFLKEEKLKEALVKFGLIKKDVLEKAEKKAKELGQKLEDLLVNEKLIEREDLTHLKAYILGIPFVNLEEEKVSPEILKIIPESIAKKYNIVAYKKEGKKLEVAMLNPEDLQVIEFIKKTGWKILPRLTTSKSIQNLLGQYKESLEMEFRKIIKDEVKGIKHQKEFSLPKETKEKLKKITEEVPIIRIVDTFLKHAILDKASDIHIEPLENKLLIRYRIDGILHDVMTLPPELHIPVIARIKILSNLKLDEHRLPQDGRFKMIIDDYKISFRVSVIPTFYGEKVVLRLLLETSKTLNLEALGLRGGTLERVYFNIRRPTGLILVTGPTGCGKTTTLYSILEILNTPEVNISTIEDPVEYTIPRVNQSQIKPEIGFTFANGLRSLLRQDPDIIMVGEIRDNETASLAINAALTGHLVLSTLHTNNAAGAIPRLLDMKVESFLLAATLKLIIAQRLVRKLCSYSKEYFLTPEEIKKLSKNYNIDKILMILKKEKIIKENQDWQNIKFGKPLSSEICPEGYKGRLGIYEVLGVTESIKELISKEGKLEEIQERAEKEGMITMLEDGFIKAAQRITSLEEVLRVTSEE